MIQLRNQFMTDNGSTSQRRPFDYGKPRKPNLAKNRHILVNINRSLFTLTFTVHVHADGN